MTMFQIERWYTGKALKTIQEYVLPTLAQAEQDGFWPKGASRKVTAALNKQSVAYKFAKANDRRDHAPECAGLLADIFDNRDQWYASKVRGYELVHAMMFGQFMHARELLALSTQLAPLVINDGERAALRTAGQWCWDFAPVADLVAKLNARRPPRVVVCKTLSPTVAGNLLRGLSLKLDTLRLPPGHFEWRKVEISGVEVEVPEYVIDWPAGTLHNKSRYAYGNHCHACGHAIRNAFNWVPLLVDDKAGVPHSLWVGTDCAKNVFGCDVSGDAIYKERG